MNFCRSKRSTKVLLERVERVLRCDMVVLLFFRRLSKRVKSAVTLVHRSLQKRAKVQLGRSAPKSYTRAAL